MLCRSHFVVLRLCEDTKFPKFLVEIFHICSNPRFYNTEIMVIKLLPFWRFRAKQRTTCENQVLALFIHLAIYQKIFLFRANRGTHILNICIAKQAKNPKCLLVEGLHGAQQRRFFVKCLPAVGTKCRWDTQCFPFYKCIRGRVPCSITTCFKCRT